VAGKWGEAFAFFIEQRLGAGAIEGLPHATPPVKDPTAFNTHHVVATPILWAMLTSEVTTCTQGLQAQRRDQKRWSLWCSHALASCLPASSSPLSCAAGVMQADQEREDQRGQVDERRRGELVGKGLEGLEGGRRGDCA
jgi:hypothetical protein